MQPPPPGQQGYYPQPQPYAPPGAMQPVRGPNVAMQLADPVYVARRNFFNFLGITCRILDLQGQLKFKVKLKAFKLKEDITVFADEQQTQPVLSIKARSIIDFGATYDVVDAMTGQPLGAWRRKGLKSILKDEWELLDVYGQVIAHIKEDSTVLALLRRFLSNLIAQSYHLTVNDQQIGLIKGTWNPFVVKYTVDLSQDNYLDRRLTLAGVVLLLTIEGKQR